MKVGLRDNQDFWAGVMLVAVGAVALVIARNYPFGTALRMGPGYFPVVLASILTLFGLFFLARSLRSTEKIEAGWSLRALVVIPVTLVLFGILMTHAGFVPALMVLIFGSALASTEFNLFEVALLTVGLTLGCVAVFIWGLGLPYPLIAEF
jgi:putative tricarboxylic transport membrane protein